MGDDEITSSSAICTCLNEANIILAGSCCAVQAAEPSLIRPAEDLPGSSSSNSSYTGWCFYLILHRSPSMYIHTGIRKHHLGTPVNNIMMHYYSKNRRANSTRTHTYITIHTHNYTETTSIYTVHTSMPTQTKSMFRSLTTVSFVWGCSRVRRSPTVDIRRKLDLS